eukprot:TRINITY_DN717_c0_g1_i15.p6 TRINITY_DN717_c0_g1~~TRINITY_DN717_c0_g1_i15.p6  ORF type:complete len:114 (+),score=6.71 TRINITY_DN717_c0_g1_i15:1291-1632(+)
MFAQYFDNQLVTYNNHKQLKIEQWPDFGCEGIKVQRAHQPTSQCQGKKTITDCVLKYILQVGKNLKIQYIETNERAQLLIQGTQLQLKRFTLVLKQTERKIFFFYTKNCYFLP